MRNWLLRLVLALALLTLIDQCTWCAASYRWGGLAVLYSLGHRQSEHVIINADQGVWRVHRFQSYAIEGANWSDRFIGPLQLGKPYDRSRYGPDESHTWRELLWPTFERRLARGRYPDWYLQIPVLWTVGLNFVPVALCIVPLLRARRRRDRARQGRCVRCGYNLRGSPDRCPECGERAGDRP
jgi:hypothetical protein